MASARQTGALRSPWLFSPKGTEPHGRCHRAPAACLVEGTHFGGNLKQGNLRVTLRNGTCSLPLRSRRDTRQGSSAKAPKAPETSRRASGVPNPEQRVFPQGRRSSTPVRSTVPRFRAGRHRPQAADGSEARATKRRTIRSFSLGPSRARSRKTRRDSRPTLG